MARRTETLTVVVACDDGDLREQLRAALAATTGVDVVAAVDTAGTVPAANRLRPDAVVLASRSPRHVDLGRIGTLARDRSRRPPVLALLADEPGSVAERARAAGAAIVGPVPHDDAGVTGLVTELVGRREAAGS